MSRVVGIWGARGSGKSTRALGLVDALPRVIVFDTLRNTRLRGAAIFRSIEDVRRRAARSYDRGFRIVYHPPFSMIDPLNGKPVNALPRALSALAVTVHGLARAGGGRYPIVLLVEEMSLCFPEERQAAHVRGFYDLCLTGRHANVGIIGVAQKPALVSKVFVGNTDETYVFRPNGTADLRTAADLVGVEHLAAIRALVNYQCIHKDHTTGRVTVEKRNRK
jgi:hypothetical protein